MQAEAIKFQTKYNEKVKKIGNLKSKVKTLEKTIKDYQDLVRRMRKDAKIVTVKEEVGQDVLYVEPEEEVDDIIDLLEKEDEPIQIKMETQTVVQKSVIIKKEEESFNHMYI